MSARDAMTCSPPDCPSEAVLDAYELDELRDNDARRHIEGCAHCRARLDERQAAFAAMPGRDALLSAIHVAAAQAAPPRPARARWLAPLAAFGALATAGLVLSVSPQDSVRTKGSAGLSVYVERDGQAHRAASGETFHPGERLRFEIDLPSDRHVLIVGREASGRVYNAFPTGTVVRSQRFSVGADQVLPGAVELDASLGQETFYLVGCEHPFDSSQVTVGADDLQSPKSCLTARFIMHKVAQ